MSKLRLTRDLTLKTHLVHGDIAAMLGAFDAGIEWREARRHLHEPEVIPATQDRGVR